MTENVDEIRPLFIEGEAPEFCPKCDSGDTYNVHGFTACGVETSYKVCDNCDHQWGHE